MEPRRRTPHRTIMRPQVGAELRCGGEVSGLTREGGVAWPPVQDSVRSKEGEGSRAVGAGGDVPSLFSLEQPVASVSGGKRSGCASLAEAGPAGAEAAPVARTTSAAAVVLDVRPHTEGSRDADVAFASDVVNRGLVESDAGDRQVQGEVQESPGSGCLLGSATDDAESLRCSADCSGITSPALSRQTDADDGRERTPVHGQGARLAADVGSRQPRRRIWFAEDGDAGSESERCVDQLQVSPPAALATPEICFVCDQPTPVARGDAPTEQGAEDGIASDKQKRRRQKPPGQQRVLGGARFLQYVFRRTIQLGWRWVRGGMCKLPMIYRPAPHPRCRYGLELATPEEFASQARRAKRCVEWYSSWIHLLHRLHQGRQPLVLDLFCCAGGSSEGARRIHADAVGVDIDLQPEYVARFGEQRFVLSDALDRARLVDLIKRFRPMGILSSPPCEGSSTATFAGSPSSQERLIPATRDVLDSLGLMYLIENVVGARSEMSKDSTEVYGQMFGLPVHRPRLFECGGGMSIHLDSVLREGGAALSRRSCLGARSRYGRLDPFGRPVAGPCCSGCIYAVHGSRPFGGTHAQMAAAMGIDAEHMPYARLVKALPPAYLSLLVGQMAMRQVEAGFGIAPITFDDFEASPSECRQRMRHLLRGAGGETPTLGLQMVDAPRGRRRKPAPMVGAEPTAAVVPFEPGEAVIYRRADGSGEAATVIAVDRASEAAGEDVSVTIRFDGSSESPERSTVASRLRRGQGVGDDSRPNMQWSLQESDFRELDLTHAGDFTQQWREEGSPDWLSVLRPCKELNDQCSGAAWRGENTIVQVHPTRLRQALPALRAALSEGTSTRVTIVLEETSSAADIVDELQGFGFERALRLPAGRARFVGCGGDVRLSHDVIAWHAGWRCYEHPPRWVEYDRVRLSMDRRDAGEPAGPPGRKQAIAWTPMPARSDAWRRLGFPAPICRTMERGVQVQVVDSLEGYEIAQYAWPGREPYARALTECERAMLVGHLEAVPEHLVAEALRDGCVHPWTVTDQGDGKWRACQDYSDGTNRRVLSKPFNLPSVWDVTKVWKPGSRFAKYDLRDGFWSVPVGESSRRHLMVRHIATGRLLWCTSLPFGYGLSPYHFCEVTEAIAAVWRQRVARRSAERRCYIFCFVDDYLIVGDDDQAVLDGMRELRDLLGELHIPWAPHKERGPAAVIEFLGHLLVNLPGLQVIGLTEKRHSKLSSLIGQWWERRRPGATAEPRELAHLLGSLVFASEVVEGARTYMQSMLQQFKGLEIDWMRGTVRVAKCAWRRVHLSDGFWRDLHWWRTALAATNCVSAFPERGGECRVAGTDASDFGCGELVWIDGQREETQLVFTSAERRRPINFRELRGCLRVLELWGERLSGCTVVLEVDNTSARSAAAHLYSKAEDMQELVRRLLSRCARWGIHLQLVHTPGKLLNRPDRISRGVPPSEPRQRLIRRVFVGLEARYGPFDSFLGAERDHARAQARGGERRMWLHPSFDSVASALQLVGDRLTTDPRSCPTGLIVVPWAPSAKWWGLLRHFSMVGSFRAGSSHLEMHQLGRWRRVRAQRDSLILRFPRAAGSAPWPLRSLEAVAGLPHDTQIVPHSAHEVADMVAVSQDAPLPEGSLLYVPMRLSAEERAAMALRRGHVHPLAGCLYLTVEPYGGAGTVLRCAWLRRRDTRGADPDVFYLDRHSYDRDQETPFCPDTATVWVVTYLGSRIAGHGSSAVAVRFDFERAEADIARMRGFLARAAPSGGGATAAEQLGLSARQKPEDNGDDDERPVSGLARRGDVPVALAPRGPSQAEPPESRSRAARVPASQTGLPPMRSQSESTLCAGCGGQIGLAWCTRGGDGLVHNSRQCFDMAERRLRRAEAAAAAAPPPPRPLPPPRLPPPPPPASTRGIRPVTGTSASPIEDTPGQRGSVNSGSSASSPVLVGSESGSADSPVLVDTPAPAQTLDEGAAGTLVELGAVHEGRMTSVGAELRAIQLDERFGPARRSKVRLCLEGRCGRPEPYDMRCLGCHRQLHGVTCAELSRGFASLGCFTCHVCRLSQQFPGAPAGYVFSDAAVRAKERDMLFEMVTAQEATGASFADYASLKVRYLTSLNEVAESQSPEDSEEAFKSFLHWLATDCERALSLESVWRAAGSVMIRTGRQNLTQIPTVKLFYEKLGDSHGLTSEPMTATTQRMARLMHTRVMPDRHEGKPLMLVRSRLLFAAEYVGGLRIGEATGGGDNHGLRSDAVRVLEHVDTSETYVEFIVEHSKTKFRRIVTVVGTTRGEAAVPTAQYVREFWAECGWSTRTWIEGEYRVTCADYWVVRVSLLGLSTERRDLLFDLWARSRCAETRKHSNTSRQKGLARAIMTGSQDKKYVNVVGGPEDCGAIGTTVLEMKRAGFTEAGRISVVPGPLLVATTDVGRALTHMPLDPGSTYPLITDSLGRAYELANPEGSPDPQLDLGSRSMPRWAHHSNRRGSNSVARKTQALTGATEMEIDLTYGWQERYYNKKMQVHYEARFDRVRRAAVSSLL